MGSSFVYRLLKLILAPYLKLAYRVKIEGVDKFPKEGPVIVVGNHTSFLDSFWIPLAVPRRVVFLAKAEYFESWKTAWFFRSLGMIPIKRGSRHMAEAALATGVEVLGEGGVLGLYPEGTRSPDGRLYRGRTGVARLAMKSGAPVVAIGMSGSREIMPKEARFPKLRGRVKINFSVPMTFEKYEGHDHDRLALRAVTDEIMFEIMSLTGQSYVDEYAPRGDGKKVSGKQIKKANGTPAKSDESAEAAVESDRASGA